MSIALIDIKTSIHNNSIEYRMSIGENEFLILGVTSRLLI